MAQVIIFSTSAKEGLWSRGIGAYAIASYVRSKGYTAEVIDFINAFNFEDFCKLVEKYCDKDTILIGISSTWLTTEKWSADIKTSFGEKEKNEKYDRIKHPEYFDSFAYALEKKTHNRFIDKIKSLAPNAKIVVGGGRSIDFVNHYGIDNILIGYSENQIIDVLDKKRILPKIINHDVKGEIGDYCFSENIVEYQESDCIFPDETLSIEIGRGCIFKCKYCSFPLTGKKKLAYIKSANKLKEELLNNWNKWKVKRYIISDDTFNDDIEKLELFAEVVETLPFKPEFWCFARLDLITVKPKQIELLKKIGLKEVQFGIESFHPPTAKAIGKGLGPDVKKDTLKKIKKEWGNDIIVKCSFIIGLPYETTESIEEHYSWLASDDCPIDSVGINPLFIFKEDEYSNFRWLSDIDKNYQNYGYYFDNPRHHFDWKKKDSTDITSFDQCYHLFLKWNKIIDRAKPNHLTDAFFFANTLELNKSFNELCDKNMLNNVKQTDWKTMYFKQVKNLYVNKKLES